ncbi:uncharacterized protein LOC131627025 [Vicia villosa]|uniref:uncharacterized protein LOC131627025 n=1 Tax=Vicia villosa TaxID=3911 RepID=UPI00273C89C7|nr:uncharacterized protein LOC131627025 [Vicia villosa]
MNQMKEDESVSKYFLFVVLVTNHMKACGESINNLQKIEKVLRSMTVNFVYIIVSIEESKNPAEMKLEELQASLQAHEMRLEQRNSKREKVVEKALQAKFIKKSGKEKVNQRKNLDSDEKSSKSSKNYSDSTKKDMGNKYSRKKVDMKKVQCYKCQEFYNYARVCRRKKKVRAKDNYDMQYAYIEDSDSDHVILMVNTQSTNEKTNTRYLDSGCCNHMTENKTWFTKLDA